MIMTVCQVSQRWRSGVVTEMTNTCGGTDASILLVLAVTEHSITSTQGLKGMPSIRICLHASVLLKKLLQIMQTFWQIFFWRNHLSDTISLVGDMSEEVSQLSTTSLMPGRLAQHEDSS